MCLDNNLKVSVFNCSDGTQSFLRALNEPRNLPTLLSTEICSKSGHTSQEDLQLRSIFARYDSQDRRTRRKYGKCLENKLLNVHKDCLSIEVCNSTVR